MKKLSFLDRYLSLWIVLAMLIGLILGKFTPDFAATLSNSQSGTTNIPLAIGLVLMMYPPLVKVKFAELPKVFQNVRLLSLSLVQNWVLGPLLMFVFAALFLWNEPAYFTGLMLIGVARCIAMVLVWNDLADGNREYAAGLVAFNAIFQIVFYGVYASIFAQQLPAFFNLPAKDIEISTLQVAETVFIYLGIPFALAILSRFLVLKFKGQKFLEQSFLPNISPITLIALLLTIVLMFSLKAEEIIQLPLEIVKIAIPLSLYFAFMFSLAFWLSKKAGADYSKSTALAFTAAGNNFELGIAVSVALFGLSSPITFATVVGPLIEVPVLLLMVRLAKRWRW